MLESDSNMVVGWKFESLRDKLVTKVLSTLSGQTLEVVAVTGVEGTLCSSDSNLLFYLGTTTVGLG